MRRRVPGKLSNDRLEVRSPAQHSCNGRANAIPRSRARPTEAHDVKGAPDSHDVCEGVSAKSAVYLLLTRIAVPLLPPSRSWFADGWYAATLDVTDDTVSFTDIVESGKGSL